MRHTLPIAPQFYVTAPQPCPYLDGRQERKLFTALPADNAARLNDALSKQGFRRSQNVLYRPSCAECTACLSARIRVADFQPSRSQRRALKRNSDLRRAIHTRFVNLKHSSSIGGTHVEHLGARFNLSNGVGAHAAEIAGSHLSGKLFATGRIDAFTNDDERMARADNNGFGW